MGIIEYLKNSVFSKFSTLGGKYFYNQKNNKYQMQNKSVQAFWEISLTHPGLMSTGAGRGLGKPAFPPASRSLRCPSLGREREGDGKVPPHANLLKLKSKDKMCDSTAPWRAA